MAEDRRDGNPEDPDSDIPDPSRRRFLKRGAKLLGAAALLSAGIATGTAIGTGIVKKIEELEDDSEKTPKDVVDLFDKMMPIASALMDNNKTIDLGEDKYVVDQGKITFEREDNTYILQRDKPSGLEIQRTFQSYDKKDGTNFFVHIYPDHIDQTVIRYTNPPPNSGLPKITETNRMKPDEIKQFYKNLKAISKGKPVPQTEPAKTIPSYVKPA